VRCPLHDSTSCGWRGDLSEVSAHLTNSESHLKGQDYAPSNATQNAEALKNQGNAKFQSHAYREAIQLYSKAISAAPGVASYYGNRAAAWLMVGAAQECAEDCKRAIQLDSGYVKGYVRLAKALVELSRSFDGGFMTFVLPLIVDSIFNKIAPWLFMPNTIQMLQREEWSFSAIAKRKWLDRFMQSAVIASFVSAVGCALLKLSRQFIFPFIARALARGGAV